MILLSQVAAFAPSLAYVPLMVMWGKFTPKKEWLRICLTGLTLTRINIETDKPLPVQEMHLPNQLSQFLSLLSKGEVSTQFVVLHFVPWVDSNKLIHESHSDAGASTSLFT